MQCLAMWSVRRDRSIVCALHCAGLTTSRCSIVRLPSHRLFVVQLADHVCDTRLGRAERISDSVCLLPCAQSRTCVSPRTANTGCKDRQRSSSCPWFGTDGGQPQVLQVLQDFMSASAGMSTNQMREPRPRIDLKWRVSCTPEAEKGVCGACIWMFITREHATLWSPLRVSLLRDVFVADLVSDIGTFMQSAAPLG